MAAKKSSSSVTTATTESESPSSAPASDEIAKLSFEEAMAELEGMIERIESGEIGLEKSLEEYERGIELFRHCRRILNQAEQRFEKLRLEGEAEENEEAKKAAE